VSCYFFVFVWFVGRGDGGMELGDEGLGGRRLVGFMLICLWGQKGVCELWGAAALC